MTGLTWLHNKHFSLIICSCLPSPYISTRYISVLSRDDAKSRLLLLAPLVKFLVQYPCPLFPVVFVAAVSERNARPYAHPDGHHRQHRREYRRRDGRCPRRHGTVSFPTAQEAGDLMRSEFAGPAPNGDRLAVGLQQLVRRY